VFESPDKQTNNEIEIEHCPHLKEQEFQEFWRFNLNFSVCFKIKKRKQTKKQRSKMPTKTDKKLLTNIEGSIEALEKENQQLESQVAALLSQGYMLKGKKNKLVFDKKLPHSFILFFCARTEEMTVTKSKN
jgi:hypothetical protein